MFNQFRDKSSRRVNPYAADCTAKDISERTETEMGTTDLSDIVIIHK